MLDRGHSSNLSFACKAWMLLLATVAILFTALPFSCDALKSDSIKSEYDYCVVGGGPAGTQMAYFLDQAQRDYVVLERCDMPGCFFSKFPRHRTLISINKRFTGVNNSDYNERHDWNSLVTHNHEGPKFTNYAEELFPSADHLVRYVNDFVNYFHLNIHTKQEVQFIQRLMDMYDDPMKAPFRVTVRNQSSGMDYQMTCKYMLMANGLNQPIRPVWANDRALDYSNMQTNKSHYDGKRVMIIGTGNAAFETANHLKDSAAFVRMITRTKEIPLSFQTHYVGHARGLNLQFLDLYQLKSLVAVNNGWDVNREKFFEYNEEDDSWAMGPYKENLKYYKEWAATIEDKDLLDQKLNDKIEIISEFSYDEIITCMGWTMNLSIFSENTKPKLLKVPNKNPKHPEVTEIFQGKDQPNVYFLGTNAHTYDKNASGGFIHGFRYQIRALHRILEQKNHGNHWPYAQHSSKYLALHLLKRINTAPGPYQMFHTLCDVIVKMKPAATSTDMDAGEFQYRYFTDYPLKLLNKIPEITGVDFGEEAEVMIWYFDYGETFSCVGCNTLRADRVKNDKYNPFDSNFIHPIFNQYMLKDMAGPEKPIPIRKFALTENALAFWLLKGMYYNPLANFLHASWRVDNSGLNYDDQCMRAAIQNQELCPKMCDKMFFEVPKLGEAALAGPRKPEQFCSQRDKCPCDSAL
ncbi:FAD-dependent oxidoreductase domain-containing protein 2-like [Convolutriloba macropyga]|uniref:FAD-dependent oxidoreductase domain-containing protein 2-like n=1 Tax=Convolutriloba macropyga TaxID=536237 RepID=UPI003F521CF1